MAKYRRSIGRHSKKKIPPGRKGKHVNTPSTSNIEEENKQQQQSLMTLQMIFLNLPMQKN